MRLGFKGSKAWLRALYSYNEVGGIYLNQTTNTDNVLRWRWNKITINEQFERCFQFEAPNRCFCLFQQCFIFVSLHFHHCYANHRQHITLDTLVSLVWHMKYTSFSFFLSLVEMIRLEGVILWIQNESLFNVLIIMYFFLISALEFYMKMPFECE